MDTKDDKPVNVGDEFVVWDRDFAAVGRVVKTTATLFDVSFRRYGSEQSKRFRKRNFALCGKDYWNSRCERATPQALKDFRAFVAEKLTEQNRSQLVAAIDWRSVRELSPEQVAEAMKLFGVEPATEL